MRVNAVLHPAGGSLQLHGATAWLLQGLKGLFPACHIKWVRWWWYCTLATFFSFVFQVISHLLFLLGCHNSHIFVAVFQVYVVTEPWGKGCFELGVQFL